MKIIKIDRRRNCKIHIIYIESNDNKEIVIVRNAEIYSPTEIDPYSKSCRYMQSIYINNNCYITLNKKMYNSILKAIRDNKLFYDDKHVWIKN